MPFTLTKAKPKQHLTMLLFGAPGSGKSRLATQFDDAIVVDAHGTLDSFGETLTARILTTNQPDVITSLIETLKRGQEKAAAFVIDGLSRVQDEIEATTPDNKSFYAHKRKRLQDLTDRARSLPMNVVFTVRSKDEYAKTGEIVAGYTVGPDDKVITGAGPDIDRAIPYDVDIVIEMLVDDMGTYLARVTSSKISGLPIGTVIADPTMAKILEMANLAKETDYDKIGEDHPAYGDNKHLALLAKSLNDAQGREGDDRCSAKAFVIEWKLWTGSGVFEQDKRREAVTAFMTAIAAADKAKTVPNEAASQPTAQEEPDQAQKQSDTQAQTDQDTTESATAASPVESDGSQPPAQTSEHNASEVAVEKPQSSAKLELTKPQLSGSEQTQPSPLMKELQDLFKEHNRKYPAQRIQSVSGFMQSQNILISEDGPGDTELQLAIDAVKAILADKAIQPSAAA